MAYAYHLSTRTSQLSFGLSLTGFQFKIKEDRLVLIDQYDELIFTSKKSLFVPDANFGFYFVNQKWDAGLSVLQLLQSAIKLGDKNKESDLSLYRHYYLNGGFRYSPRRDYLIEPSTLITITKQSFQIDLGTRVFYKQSYWGGLTYRTAGGAGDIVLQGGVKVNNFLFGYAFDYTLSQIRTYTIGSHEIMMAIKIGDNARRYRWLNRY